MINEQIAKEVVQEFLGNPNFLQQSIALAAMNNDINRMSKFLNELTFNYKEVLHSRAVMVKDRVTNHYSDWSDSTSYLRTEHSSENYYIALFAKSINKKIIEVSSRLKKLLKQHFDSRTDILVALYALFQDRTGFRPSRKSKIVLKEILHQQIRSKLP